MAEKKPQGVDRFHLYNANAALKLRMTELELHRQKASFEYALRRDNQIEQLLPNKDHSALRNAIQCVLRECHRDVVRAMRAAAHQQISEKRMVLVRRDIDSVMRVVGNYEYFPKLQLNDTELLDFLAEVLKEDAPGAAVIQTNSAKKQQTERRFHDLYLEGWQHNVRKWIYGSVAISTTTPEKFDRSVSFLQTILWSPYALRMAALVVLRDPFDETSIYSDNNNMPYFSRYVLPQHQMGGEVVQTESVVAMNTDAIGESLLRQQNIPPMHMARGGKRRRMRITQLANDMQRADIKFILHMNIPRFIGVLNGDIKEDEIFKFSNNEVDSRAHAEFLMGRLYR